ncbi:MAG TPA: GNAT family N-acetyltransferase [Candidatus Polarisedimenticolia bacterium]|nr:GNAT family N-acetyltransferase [Candidatus Polarisedimenticolia bacterium]
MTPRVRLVRIDDSLRQAVGVGEKAIAAACGAAVGDSLNLVRDVIAQTLALLETSPRAPEWGGFLAVDDARALVIGTCGYAHGPESDGTVEIAYFTFPAFEGKGYATAMASALLERALAAEQIRDVVAHTLPEANASTRILEKIGLRRTGEAHDPDVGKVWRWTWRS